MGAFGQPQFGEPGFGEPESNPPDPDQAAPVTVQDIYQRVCWDMLEGAGLVTGVVTVGQFLDYLVESILEFCQQTGMVKKIFTQTVLNGQAEYIVPDDILQIQDNFIGGVFINRTTLEGLLNASYEWPKEVGTPERWFEDGLPVNHVKLVPIPDYNGAAIPADQPPFGHYGGFFPEENNLTTVGSAGPRPLTLTLDDDIPSVIPKSFTAYLVYGVLYRIFSSDSESKDMQRAHYCGARWLEGIGLGQIIMQEALLSEKT